MAPKRRTAALVISTFVEPRGNPPWYARIMFYEDAQAPGVQASAQTTVEGVCDIVRAWLESVTAEETDANHGSMTGPQWV
jgi:hypothetical protein